MEEATVGDRANAARWVNLVLGSWLFVSAFLWPHARHAQTDTWFVGLLMATFAATAMAVPGARRLNALLAVWLFGSTLLLARGDMLTLLHNCFVAIAVFAFSLVPPLSAGVIPTRRYSDEEPLFG